MTIDAIILSIVAPVAAALLGILGWLIKRNLDQGKRLVIVETKLMAHENLCEGRWSAQSQETHEVRATLNRIETKIGHIEGTLTTHVSEEDQKFDMLIDLVRRNGNNK